LTIRTFCEVHRLEILDRQFVISVLIVLPEKLVDYIISIATIITVVIVVIAVIAVIVITVVTVVTIASVIVVITIVSVIVTKIFAFVFFTIASWPVWAVVNTYASTLFRIE